MTNAITLAELTWPEVAAAVKRNAGVILTCTSTEQHGPHLPIGTDAIIGTDLAMAMAHTLDLVVAPTLRYGCRSRPQSGGGQGFVGTTSLRGSTFIAVVQDVVSEFIRHGFRRIVLLAHHMENSNFLYEAAFEAMDRKPDPAVKVMVIESPFPEFSPELMRLLFPSEFPGWALEHASILETSLMLHLHPEMVRKDKVRDDRPERIVSYDVLPLQDSLVAKSGTLWKASQASAEKGRRAWDEITIGLHKMISSELFA
jgi:creatinine amidohydrolase